jgi:hypothetical protein
MSSSGYMRSMIGRKAPLSRRDQRCSRISGVSIGRGRPPCAGVADRREWRTGARGSGRTARGPTRRRSRRSGESVDRPGTWSCGERGRPRLFCRQRLGLWRVPGPVPYLPCQHAQRAHLGRARGALPVAQRLRPVERAFGLALACQLRSVLRMLVSARGVRLWPRSAWYCAARPAVTWSIPRRREEDARITAWAPTPGRGPCWPGSTSSRSGPPGRPAWIGIAY